MMKMLSPKEETGIPGFDQITNGGLPKSSAIALIGEAGSGKELLIRNIVWELLNKDARILYYSVDQSADELRSYMESYGWNINPYEEKEQINIVDVFTDVVNKVIKADDEENILSETFNPMGTISKMSYHQSLYDLKMLNKEAIKFFSFKSMILKRNEFKLVIFDSLSPLFLTNDKAVFQMIHTLKFATRVTKATGIGVVHSGVHDQKTMQTFISLADSIIDVTKVNKGLLSCISLPKYLGATKRGPFPLEMSADGAKIIPLEMPELVS